MFLQMLVVTLFLQMFVFIFLKFLMLNCPVLVAAATTQLTDYTMTFFQASLPCSSAECEFGDAACQILLI